jgi:very-short-patch-repair endonuclease
VESYDLDQREEDLTLLLRAWPDMEEVMLKKAADGETTLWGDGGWQRVVEDLRRALRVEVQEEGGGFKYVVLFDVNSYEGRQAAASLQPHTGEIDSLARRHAPVQGHRWGTQIKVVPGGKPIEGEVCPRVMAPAPDLQDLADLPEPEPPKTSVPLVERGMHRLTPIEAPFFDAMQETELTFAVQPRVQGDRVYRPDFIVFYGGRAVVVELDGHEGHKTKEQRSYDTARERWFQERGVPVVRWTGSQVFADAAACVDELLKLLRGSVARP